VAARMGFGRAFHYQNLPIFFAEYVALDGAASHIARDLDLSIFCRR
jgi:assimilatory nitrate reductase catalytic subunit